MAWIYLIKPWVCWIIPLFNLLALWCAVQKKKEAFAMFMIPNIYWIYYTVINKTYPLTVVQIIYTIFNIWGYFKWRKEAERKNGRDGGSGF